MSTSDQRLLPIDDDETRAKVEQAEAREEFERRRWKGGQKPARGRQGKLFDHLDDLPDQNYLFGE
jgi:hypothetical protein